MRTYDGDQLTPNSPAVKIKDLCRLCMNVGTTMHDIFDLNQNSSAVSVASKIFVCLSIEVKSDEWFPTKLCAACLKSLDAFTEFRERCHVINKKLEYLFEQSANSMFAPEVKPPVFTALPQISQCFDRSQTVQHCSVKDSETTTDVHRAGDCSNLFLEVDSHLCTVLNDLSQVSNSRALGLQGCSGAVSNHVLPGSENCQKDSDVTVNVDTSSKLDFEEVSDIDESGDALEVEVSMNGSSYVIEVLNEMRVMKVELPEKDCVDGSPKECSASNAEEAKLSPGKSSAHQCSFCKKVLDNSSDLKGHMQHHGKGFSCQFCHKWFSCKSGLQRHEKIHSGEKPYKCKQCSRSFSQKEILRRHVLIHSGEKPYKCSSCDKSYTQKEALKMHFKNNHVPRKITEINQYPCLLCDKSFCHLSGLSRHQQMHAGIKFPCKICDRVFTDRSCLRRHNLRVHLVEKNNAEKAGPISSA